MRNIKTLAILNAISFLLHLTLSQLTQLKLFNNQTIGSVSAKYPALFTPAGVTFSIWGLIYIALLVFCIYHLVKAFKATPHHQANTDLLQLGYLFIINNLATAAWTLAWVYEGLILSVVLMLIQLATLLAMQLRLQIYDATRPPASRWLTYVPLSLYFGWIIIATVANISAVLVGLNWDGFGLTDGTWAVIMVIVATLIVGYVVLVRSNPFVGLVGIWALYGIILKQLDSGLAESQQIITVAWPGVALLVLLVLAISYRNLTGTKKARINGAPEAAANQL
ncbi:hypothetical protein [Pontibacter burrus]|uniref:hypothetical protein n=1 Tax=Pontibacter burrus TaxID=2704466 RepID=UPI001954B3F2|nr:hypothetical protein [Pontibacter burrus]